MYTSPLVDTLSSPTSYQKSPNNRNFYISPTYQSSIFNHTQTFTPAARETRHASNQASSTYRETTDNVNKGNARVVFDVRRIITEDFQKDLAKIEKKRQENIQRKKPTEEDIRSFEASQNEYQKLMTRRKTEIQTEKINYRNDLIRQMEERSRRRTLELEETGETSQRRFGLSMSMNASPARDLYPSVGKGSRSRERESSLEKTEESGVVKVVKRGQKKVNEYNSKGSERSKEVKRNQLPYSSGYVVAQTVRGQGSLERILSKAMKSPKGNSTERRPVLEKDRSPSSELTLPMKSKAEKPTQMRVQSATQIGQRNLSGEKKAPVVNKKQEKKGISPGFNPLLKDKPVTVKKDTRMRRGAANRDENEIEEVKPERQLQFDREAVDYMRNKKLEQISRLTGSVGKQSEMLLDVIDEDPSLQLNDEEFEEEQMNISIKRTVKDHDDEDSHAPRIMDLKGFFKSKINGNELRALESDRTDRTGDNPDSQSRRGSNSERSEQKDILEALMEKRKDLLNYLRGLKGKLSQSANKREIEKEYGSNEKEKGKSSSKGAKPKDKTGGIDWMRENMTAKQKLLQQGRSTTVKPINELIMAQIFERQRASKDERKVEASAETDYEKKSEKYKGYEPSQGSTDVFSKQMKILQQYKRNMKFYGYPENYSSAGSKM